MPYVVQVTDANGAGVANVPLSLSVLSVKYDKGDRDQTPPWDQNISGAGCPDEDLNHKRRAGCRRGLEYEYEDRGG
jgi:hypothetical protein